MSLRQLQNRVDALEARVQAQLAGIPGAADPPTHWSEETGSVPADLTPEPSDLSNALASTAAAHDPVCDPELADLLDRE